MKSWMFAKEFPEDYTIIYDQSEIKECLSFYGIDDLKNDITAVAVRIGDGEFMDLWYSLDNAPWKNSSIYEHFSTIIETEEFMLAENFIQVKSASGGRNLPFGALE